MERHLKGKQSSLCKEINHFNMKTKINRQLNSDEHMYIDFTEIIK